jgi:hypothetical protein
MAGRMFTPCHILKCETLNNKGTIKKMFVEQDDTFFIAFSNFQGTETTKNDVYTVLETAVICSPFIPDLSNADKIKLLDTGAEYEIISPLENWNMQNLFLLFKVQRVKGGV